VGGSFSCFVAAFCLPPTCSVTYAYLVSSLFRFLLKDTKTNEWYDVGIEYAREKVSHALRSRPNEERRKRSIQQPKNKRIQRGGGNNDSAAPGSSPGSSTGDKSTNGSSLELEETVKSLIHDQQQLLKSMIQKESFPVYS
jgi:hypothetical protein